MLTDRQSLVVALRDSLQDAATRLDTPGDLERVLDLAALDFHRARRRTRQASVQITAGVGVYAAPVDLLEVQVALWGQGHAINVPPWEPNWAGPLPRLSSAYGDSGRQLLIEPAPTALQISRFGADFGYLYTARHSIGDTEAETTVQSADVGLLLLRAQAEAMKELAMRASAKPVKLRDGQTQGTRNGTPAALFKQLMDEYERQAVR